MNKQTASFYQCPKIQRITNTIQTRPTPPPKKKKMPVKDLPVCTHLVKKLQGFPPSRACPHVAKIADGVGLQLSPELRRGRWLEVEDLFFTWFFLFKKHQAIFPSGGICWSFALSYCFQTFGGIKSRWSTFNLHMFKSHHGTKRKSSNQKHEWHVISNSWWNGYRT